jgi:hypothetical protein
MIVAVNETLLTAIHLCCLARSRRALAGNTCSQPFSTTGDDSLSFNLFIQSR